MHLVARAGLLLGAASLGLQLVACKDPADSRSKDTAHDRDTADTSEDTEDTEETGDSKEDTPPPCDGGTWGGITHAKSAIHVSQDHGSEEGDGSMGSPVDTLSAAVELTRGRTSEKYIAIWPGSYRDNVSLRLRAPKDTTDEGTVIQGCSASEVLVSAADSGGAVFSISEARGVEISSLSSQGGTRGIEALTGAQVTLTALKVSQATEAGVLIHGGATDDALATTADLVDVYVRDASPKGTDAGSETEYGYGLTFQAGAIATMSGGGSYDNRTAGILADLVMSLEIDNVEVRDTSWNESDYLGRGIQIQRGSTATIRNSTISGNQDAGIFGLQAAEITLIENHVEGTLCSSIPDIKGTSGDGIVVSQGEEAKKPSYFRAVLEGNVVADCTRAGVVLDGVQAQVSGNSLSGNRLADYGDTVIEQGSAEVSGTDITVAPALALELNKELLSSMALSE